MASAGTECYDLGCYKGAAPVMDWREETPARLAHDRTDPDNLKMERDHAFRIARTSL